jgi:arylformamidase
VLHDISPLLRPTIAVWPGDTPLAREVLADLDRGDPLTLSTLHATVHLGAHADSPHHTAGGSGDIASQPLEPYLGPCHVITVDVAPGERITPADVRVPVTEARVLFHTGTYPDADTWTAAFAGLDPGLVAHLAAQGVRLIGIDTPSVDPFDDTELRAHAACVAHDVRVLEGVVLHAVPDGVYELIALPLRLEGFDASPVRAVLRDLPPR